MTDNDNSLSSGGSDLIVSSNPIVGSKPLGDAFVALAEDLPHVSIPMAKRVEAHDLRAYRESRLKYWRADKIERISTLEAVQIWTANRLRELELPVVTRFSSVSEDQLPENDRQASLKLIELAEDFVMITGFCREAISYTVEAQSVSHGISYTFRCLGNCHSANTRIIENKGLSIIASKQGRENSLKVRVDASSQGAEMQILVLKEKLRLGFSPRLYR